MYWALPYAAKCWAASWNARRLDSLRYGQAYEKAISSIRARDSWSSEDFVEYQRRELATILEDAAVHVPYYRDLFVRLRMDPRDISSPNDLPGLPILEKATIRETGESLIDERRRPDSMVPVSTSGTTGSPLVLYGDVQSNSARFAFADARWHGIVGVARRDVPSVSVGGQLVTAPNRNHPPFWVENRRWKQLYLSSYHLSEGNLGHYVQMLRAFGGTYIEGYPSSLHQIARHIIDRSLEPLRFRACFTTAELLFDDQRDAFRRAFGCRTYDQYGCAEMVVFAAECEHGTLHLSPEVGIVEVLDDLDRPVAEGEVGSLVCTGLLNRTQPLVRYRIGDLGAVKRAGCPCGSALPILSALDGRMDAGLLTRDGRRIGRLDPVFKGVEGVVEAQIVQETLENIEIRVVPGIKFDGQTAALLRDNLAARVGSGLRISVTTVDSIERTAAGKFQAVLCRIPRGDYERASHED